MIHHWKGLDQAITDFTYHRDPTQSGETILSQTATLKHVETVNVSDKPTRYVIGKVLIRRSQISVITVIRQPQVKTYHLKRQTLKHVEIIKVSDKPSDDTLLEWF